MAKIGKPRGVWAQVFKNFRESFKSNQSTREGTYIGSDLNGNKFYEVPAEPAKGKRSPRRWFIPEKEMHFDVSNMSAEWDAWLRNRRQEPPALEELQKNQAIAAMKKLNGEKWKLRDAKLNSALSDVKNTPKSFPKHEEYDVQPGKGLTKYREEDYK